MAYESFSVSELVPAEPARIYSAWLSSEEHTAFTGDAANIEPFVGGKHSSFGGYSFGSTVELQPGARIVQTWRAEDFPPGTPDSRVEVTLEPTVGGTMVTIFHTEIPPGQSDNYRDGWLKFYLEPLKKYFGLAPAKANGVSRPTAAKRLAKAKSPPMKKPAKKAATKKAATRKAAPMKAAKKKPAKKAAKKKPAATKAAKKKPKKKPKKKLAKRRS